MGLRGIFLSGTVGRSSSSRGSRSCYVGSPLSIKPSSKGGKVVDALFLRSTWKLCVSFGETSLRTKTQALRIHELCLEPNMEVNIRAFSVFFITDNLRGWASLIPNKNYRLSYEIYRGGHAGFGYKVVEMR